MVVLGLAAAMSDLLTLGTPDSAALINQAGG